LDAFSSLGFTEAGRSLQINTPEGKDAFLTEKFWCRQVVNGLDEGKVVLRAKRDDVKAQDIVGKEVTVSLMTDHLGGRREWNYLVIGLSEQPRLTRGLRQYELALRPTLWLMSQRSDCRIFLNKTAVQIAEILCDEHGIKGLDTSRVFDLPPAQEYTVQWMETDLDFLMRMFQKFGIFFWTRQDNGKQVLVLSNKSIGWDKGADGDKGMTRIASGSTAETHISEWRADYQFVPGKHAGRDWNFEDPNRVQRSDINSTVELPRNGSYEIYQYPALAMNGREAQKQMTSHAQASEAAHQTIVGKSDCRDLQPGAKVTPFDLSNPQYAYETAVIMSIEHTAVNPSYETTDEGTGPDYFNEFTALPASLPATPQRTIPRPRIDGTQIAIIAGPQGEQIHCDKYGRIKLKHLWDRRAKGDGTDTKWIRVIQPWAGSGWGVQVIPRIGMEAVVSFEDGDPDRPIVIGLVPNPNMKVPEDLPANKTRMIIKSDTYKGIGYNELRFEDWPGREEVYVHAQRDMNEHIGHNRVELIKMNMSSVVYNDKYDYIGRHRETNVRGSYEIHVGKKLISPKLEEMYRDRHDNFSYLGDIIGKDTYNTRWQSRHSRGAFVVHTEGDQLFHAGETFDARAEHTAQLSSRDHAGITSGSIKLDAKKSVAISAKSVSILAAEEFNINVGASHLKITKDGTITLRGALLKIIMKEALYIVTSEATIRASKLLKLISAAIRLKSRD
jgi:type VI secretion system secreted protein VgrG